MKTNMVDNKPNSSEEDLYRKAKIKVEAKKGFYIHFAVYISVNVLMIIIWAVTGTKFPWFIFPLGGWGIGLLFHYLGVFVLSGRGIREWERKRDRKRGRKITKAGGLNRRRSDG